MYHPRGRLRKPGDRRNCPKARSHVRRNSVLPGAAWTVQSVPVVFAPSEELRHLPCEKSPLTRKFHGGDTPWLRRSAKTRGLTTPSQGGRDFARKHRVPRAAW